ncbi:MAG: NAD(P)-dependent alcohol dehydrogenase [Polyangiaceae bacterium]
MKTLLFRQRVALDDLAEVERPQPEPGPREVRVAVRAVSLNYRDVAIARGRYPAAPAPLVPGSDAAGVIDALGPGLRRGFEVGERVALQYVPDWIDGPPRADSGARRLGGSVDGVLAEQLVVHEEALVRLPAHLSFCEASTMPIAGVTAWQALVEDGRVRAGDVVGVTGTGGVSLFALQVARIVGAEVVVIGRDPGRLARARALGARAVPAEADWDRAVLELTGGRGVDAFLDVVGGDALSRAVAATRVGGVVSVVGFVGGASANVDLTTLIRRAITLRAASGGSRRSFEALVRALETTGTRPVVDRVFPFGADALRGALAHLAEGHPFGKVVIDLELGR